MDWFSEPTPQSLWRILHQKMWTWLLFTQWLDYCI